MTEKQGGSDVRANVTQARPTEVDGEYTLHGHKWFTSAPMNDVFLVLAQARRGHLLPCASGAAGRDPQPHRRRPAQGQARQPVQRLVRAGARGHPRRAARRRGTRRAHHHRDGRRDPARLRRGLGLADAPGGVRGHLARGPPVGLRVAARRQAADAERAGRSGRRVRGGHRAGGPSRGRRRRPCRSAGGGVPRGSRSLSPSSGSASAPRRSPPRRSSASAATVTSRSR